jgi:hypothetical protein
MDGIRVNSRGKRLSYQTQYRTKFVLQLGDIYPGEQDCNMKYEYILTLIHAAKIYKNLLLSFRERRKHASLCYINNNHNNIIY